MPGLSVCVWLYRYCEDISRFNGILSYDNKKRIRKLTWIHSYKNRIENKSVFSCWCFVISLFYWFERVETTKIKMITLVSLNAINRRHLFPIYNLCSSKWDFFSSNLFLYILPMQSMRYMKFLIFKDPKAWFTLVCLPQCLPFIVWRIHLTTVSCRAVDCYLGGQSSHESKRDSRYYLI